MGQNRGVRLQLAAKLTSANVTGGMADRERVTKFRGMTGARGRLQSSGIDQFRTAI